MTSTPEQPAAAAGASATPPEWKPEPRQWTWKDLFTAPMLAFKPKCMLISAVTLIGLGLWAWLYDASHIGQLGTPWRQLITLLWLAVGLVGYSLGASLVAVFMRADLLDDEFLSLREGLGQFRTRLLPALLVPLFLLALVVGVNGILVVADEFFSIPYLGSSLYALLYPLGWCFALFAVLLLIAVGLSLFVFPAIIAIRKHGWFDNVVDTIEAVGTKPHVLVGSLILTLILVAVAFQVGNAGIGYLNGMTRRDVLFNKELAITEDRSEQVRESLVSHVDPLPYLACIAGKITDDRVVLPKASFAPVKAPDADTSRFPDPSKLPDANKADPGPDAFHQWGPGLVVGLWKSGILVVLLGYCMNLLIGGGMLTYLLVREDDYWDDEDLEDLDKLAKELEEEAKREEAAAVKATSDASAAAAPASAPPAPASPAPVPAPAPTAAAAPAPAPAPAAPPAPTPPASA
jgi:hypothetical protein